MTARTGRTWDEWFALIDTAGGESMDHRTLASFLHREHGVDGWWAQMVTVGYEQARGKREPHQRADGRYEVSGSRVIGAPVERVYSAFVDDGLRARWMPDVALTVHKATPPRVARATWTDGSKSIVVSFTPKGEAKTQIAVQHGQLADAAEAERMKAFWGERLDAFKSLLEGG